MTTIGMHPDKIMVSIKTFSRANGRTEMNTFHTVDIQGDDTEISIFVQAADVAKVAAQLEQAGAVLREAVETARLQAEMVTP